MSKLWLTPEVSRMEAGRWVDHIHGNLCSSGPDAYVHVALWSDYEAALHQIAELKERVATARRALLSGRLQEARFVLEAISVMEAIQT